MFRGLSVICAAFILLAGSSGRCTVAIGLNASHGIFVQEYRVGDELRYCIHNARAESVRLILRETWFDDSPQRRGDITVVVFPGRRVTGDTLAVLVLGPAEFVQVPSVVTPKSRFVEYVANEKPIGLVCYRELGQLDCVRSVCMPTNLNGDGELPDGMWTEQDSLWVRSGEEFTVDLVFEQGAGEIKIYKRPLQNVTQSQFVAPYDIECSAMVVASLPDEFVISASSPAVLPGIHRATLKFRAPEVDAASLFKFGGYVWVKYGSSGYPISRGVFVYPSDGGRLPPNNRMQLSD